MWKVRLWEALSVALQKWIPFPTALLKGKPPVGWFKWFMGVVPFLILAENQEHWREEISRSRLAGWKGAGGVQRSAEEGAGHGATMSSVRTFRTDLFRDPAEL